MNELLQLIANGLVLGSIIALAAIGLSLVYGILKIVNFAHGDFLTFGVYMAFIMNITWNQHMILAAIFAIVMTAALGVSLEYGLWRPIRQKGAGIVSLFIVAIGLALVLRHTILLFAGGRPRRFDVDVFQVHELGPIRLSNSQLIVIGVAVVAIVAVGLLLSQTTIGKAMRALSDSRDLASVSGIDTDRITAHTWILGAGLAGLAGTLQGLVQNAFEPNMGFRLLLLIFAAVVLGGVGSAYGALAGGLALGVMMEVATWSQLPATGVPTVYKPVVAFAVLIAVLILRPQGIFGKARTV